MVVLPHAGEDADANTPFNLVCYVHNGVRIVVSLLFNPFNKLMIVILIDTAQGF